MDLKTVTLITAILMILNILANTVVSIHALITIGWEPLGVTWAISVLTYTLAHGSLVAFLLVLYNRQ